MEIRKKTRQQLRNEKRKNDKMKSKVYTYDEMQQIRKQFRKQYDLTYAIALATSLHAEPFKFGKVRVCRAVKALFGQLDAIENNVLEAEVLIKEAEELGVKIKQDQDTLEIYIDLGDTIDKGDYV